MEKEAQFKPHFSGGVDICYLLQIFLALWMRVCVWKRTHFKIVMWQATKMCASNMPFRAGSECMFYIYIYFFYGTKFSIFFFYAFPLLLPVPFCSPCCCSLRSLPSSLYRIFPNDNFAIICTFFSIFVLFFLDKFQKEQICLSLSHSLILFSFCTISWPLSFCVIHLILRLSFYTYYIDIFIRFFSLFFAIQTHCIWIVCVRACLYTSNCICSCPIDFDAVIKCSK